MVATIFVEAHVFFVQLLGTLSKRRRQRQCREARKIFLRNPGILLSISLLWLLCNVCFWNPVDSSVPSLDFSSWNVGHGSFEDSVEMEQLKSHLRAGRHKCQLYFTYSRALLFLDVLRVHDCAPAQCLDTVPLDAFFFGGQGVQTCSAYNILHTSILLIFSLPSARASPWRHI